MLRAMGLESSMHPVKLTPAAKEKALEHLRSFGTVGGAARAAGVSRQCLRMHRSPTLDGGEEPNPVYDPEFAAAWEEALEDYRESLVEEATSRARDGWVERPVINKDGEHIGDVLKKSDRLMELFLKRHDPSFREKSRVELGGELRGKAEVEFTPPDFSKLSRRGRAAMRTVLTELTGAGEQEEAGGEVPVAVAPGGTDGTDETVEQGAEAPVASDGTDGTGGQG